MRSQFTIEAAGGARPVVVEEQGGGVFVVTIGDERVVVDAQQLGATEYHLLCDGWCHDLLVVPGGGQQPVVVHRDGAAIPVPLLDELRAARLVLAGAARAAGREADGQVAIRAPMPGKVVKALVRVGEGVAAGQGIIVIEAMKMENELRSTVAGTVCEIRVAEGDNVEAGERLVVIE